MIFCQHYVGLSNNSLESFSIYIFPLPALAFLPSLRVLPEKDGAISNNNSLSLPPAKVLYGGQVTEAFFHISPSPGGRELEGGGQVVQPGT